MRETTKLLIAAAIAIGLFGCGGSGEQSSRAVQGGPAMTRNQLGDAFAISLPDASVAVSGVQQPQRVRQGGLATNFVVDAQDREAVRMFYNSQFVASQEPPMNWTGDYATGNPGTVSQDYLDFTLRRINAYRALAGVPAGTTLLDTYNQKDQAAAMMFSMNNMLSHYPSSSWVNYSANAAEAAGHSNIANQPGAYAIDMYMMDEGSANTAVGHRRWLLNPPTTKFGAGSVPGRYNNGVLVNMAANAIWVHDSSISARRPDVRDEFVAWPTRGYTPYNIFPGFWSFSYPGANFSTASVSVTSGGAAIPIKLMQVANGVGENSIVWTLPGTDENGTPTISRPNSDVAYQVTIKNVLIGTSIRTFNYDVIMFDPSVPTVGVKNAVSAVTPVQREAQTFNVSTNKVDGAISYQFAIFGRRAFSGTVITPANSKANWIERAAPGYSIIGTSEFRIHHTFPRSMNDAIDQYITYANPIYVSADAILSFKKSRGMASSGEYFQVLVSTDDGVNWDEVYRENGNGQSGTPEQIAISLNKYAGRKVLLRFALPNVYNTSLSICDTCGWGFTDIRFQNADELLDEKRIESQGATAAQTVLGQAGAYVLFTRAQFDSYYGLWGSGAELHVDGQAFAGPKSNYSIVKTADGYTVTDNVGGDGVKRFRYPYRLDFKDVSVAFDIDGNAGKAYRLYQAAFNRQPDLPGLGFWIKVVDSGYSLTKVASGFIASQEFKSIYGLSPSNDKLVTAMYANALHRVPDEGGFAFWVSLMNKGLSVEDMLNSFSESPENHDQVYPSIALGMTYVRN